MKAKTKDERLNRIVAHAETIFFEKGFANTSISDICKAARCSRTTLYSYFDTRENIYLAVSKKAFHACFEYYSDITISASNGLERVLAHLDVYYQFCNEYPQHAALILDFQLIVMRVDSEKLQSDVLMAIVKSSNFNEVVASAQIAPSVIIAEIEKGIADNSITDQKTASALFIHIWAYIYGVISMSNYTGGMRRINFLNLMKMDNV